MGKKNKLKRKKQQQAIAQAVQHSTVTPTPPSIPLWICISIIIAFSFVLYGNTIGHGYALDDVFVTAQNPIVKKGLHGIPEIFSNFYVDMDFIERKGGYRPITTTTFAIEYTFFGENTTINHFTQISLYALSCIMLFFFLCYLFPQYPVLFPLFITLLFIAYPRHTEVVASLKSRDELLAFLFGITSTFLLLQYYDKRKIYYLLFGLFILLLGYFSKESAISFSITIPLVLYFFRNIQIKHAFLIFIFLFFFILSIAAITMTIFILLPLGITDFGSVINRTMEKTHHPLATEDDWFNHISTRIYIMGYYLKMLLYPLPMVFFYGPGAINVVGWTNPWVWLTSFFYLGIGGFTLRQMLAGKRHVLHFAFWYFLGALSVYSNIAGLVPGVVGDRLLFHPSLGLCIGLAWLLFKFSERQSAKSNPTVPLFTSINTTRLIVLSLFLLLPYSYITIVRNADWKNMLTLLKADEHKIQHSVGGLTVSAISFAGEAEKTITTPANRERYAYKAIEQFKKVLHFIPNDFHILTGIGTLYCEILNQPEEAVRYFEYALADTTLANPLYALGYSRGGNCYQNVLKQKDKASEYYEQYVKLKPKDVQIRSKLVQYYLTQGSIDKAITINKEIQTLAPHTDFAHLSAGLVSLTQQDTLAAIQHFEQSIELDKKNSNLAKLLSDYYLGKGNMAKHEYFKQKSLNGN